ncbi:RsmE family RNA methyltransferase [Dethiosulfatarculus sandiegensis]|uniref:Ribosomal RNA small subunit methyltransferase E n=1 Tax=Dethiosulfatarculus sandiegensis TaxID=1429043 RepID=A0A0D2JVC7_9BACT|nr:RsmE family RNA methyltransferase [Dethiosulfatarculus sandiegensis]KIX13500.1 hypothetical protein X474_13525 [Dethiosulfatarculus sandiegensis]
MSKRRFLISGSLKTDQVVDLPSEEAAHARKVLRLKKDDLVELMNGRGLMALAQINRVDKKQVSCLVRKTWQKPRPLPKLVLCCGLIKGGNMDLLAQKFTELAVDEVRPFESLRSVKKLKNPTERIERWERIAGQALKQCGAAHPPAFMPPAEYTEILEAAPPQAGKVMLYENQEHKTLAQVLTELKDKQEIWALVGPEGGFSSQEAIWAEEAGFIQAGLPHVILRAETACLTLASLVRFRL